MTLEKDTFVRIEDLGTHKVAVMRTPSVFIGGRVIPGLQPDEFRMDRKSLHSRIVNLARCDYPTDQSKAALKALEAAIKEEANGKD